MGNSQTLTHTTTTATTNDYQADREWSNEYSKINDQLLGEGAFGKVWLVRNRADGTKRAMKVIDLSMVIRKFKQDYVTYAEEYKRAQNLSHENIVSYIDWFRTSNEIYIILEFCDGGSLRDHIGIQLNRHDIFKTYFDENLIWFWSNQMLKGIEYIHSHGIIHRDLKPDNVFIDSSTGKCKIGDFGFAKLLDDHSSHVSHVGTGAYMPPELEEYMNAQNIHYRSAQHIAELAQRCIRFAREGDVFSLGCVLFELATLKQRKMLNSHFSSDIRYTPQLKNFITSTLDLDPSRRPSIRVLLENERIRENENARSFFDQHSIPTLNLSQNFTHIRSENCFIHKSLENFYKPNEVVTLKINFNYILISLNRYMNNLKRSTSVISSMLSYLNGSDDKIPPKETCIPHSQSMSSSITPLSPIQAHEERNSLDESKIVVYSEHGEQIKVFNCYLKGTLSIPFDFKILGMTIDEEQSHLYISTSTHCIFRFRFDCLFANDLYLDGILEMEEFEHMYPSVLHLIIDKHERTRFLLFSDRNNMRITSIKVGLNSHEYRVQCDLEWGMTVSDTHYVQRILTQQNELVCLLSDFETIVVYNLHSKVRNTLAQKTRSQIAAEYKDICADSSGLLYATNGHSFHTLRSDTFRAIQKFKPLKNFADNKPKRNSTLFESIILMKILTNGKLVLIKDAILNENSELYILQPRF